MAANLRNKPVDRRRLKAEDRNFNTGKRQTALKRARRRAGNIAYQENRPQNTTLRYKGRNQFAPGIQTQQLRMKELSANKRRLQGLRPDDNPLPSINSKLEF